MNGPARPGSVLAWQVENVTPHWECGHRCHGFWLGAGTRLAVVGIPHRRFRPHANGEYYWETAFPGRPTCKGREASLRAAKAVVDRSWRTYRHWTPPPAGPCRLRRRVAAPAFVAAWRAVLLGRGADPTAVPDALPAGTGVSVWLYTAAERHAARCPDHGPDCPDHCAPEGAGRLALAVPWVPAGTPPYSYCALEFGPYLAGEPGCAAAALGNRLARLLDPARVGPAAQAAQAPEEAP